MREILFRGKRTDNGEWAKGYYIHRPTAVCIGESNPSYIWVPPVDPDDNTKIFEVFSETVGQFTRLTDRNNNMIFEGDIVRLTDEHNEIEWTAVVVFGNPNGEYNWGWQLKAIGEFDGNKDILLWVDMEDSGAYCEVIGNIYDNPELLEGS